MKVRQLLPAMLPFLSHSATHDRAPLARLVPGWRPDSAPLVRPPAPARRRDEPGASVIVLRALPGAARRAVRQSRSDGAIRVIMMTDVEGSTSLTQRLGDVAARAVMRAHDNIVRAALDLHHGVEIKHTGDGFLAAFGSACLALDCAAAIQDELARCEETAPHHLRVRIGINAGEPIAEEGDLFGTAVIAAARVMQLAAGGEILVSDVVRQLVAGRGFQFASRGASALRGFDELTEVFTFVPGSWCDFAAAMPGYGG